MWRLNNTFLNNQQVTEGIKREIKTFLETSDNENTTIQHVWQAPKAILRGKFMAIQSYLRKEEKHQQTPKTTGKRRRRTTTTTKNKISRKKAIIKN